MSQNKIHLHNLRNVKNANRGVLLLKKLQAEACDCTKSSTPPWAFFAFFKFYKWYQIAQYSTSEDLGTPFHGSRPN